MENSDQPPELNEEPQQHGDEDDPSEYDDDDEATAARTTTKTSDVIGYDGVKRGARLRRTETTGTNANDDNGRRVKTPAFDDDWRWHLHPPPTHLVHGSRTTSRRRAERPRRYARDAHVLPVLRIGIETALFGSPPRADLLTT